MLWFKAWLETRWRFGLIVGMILLTWLTPLWLPAFGFRLPPGVPASRIWLGVHLGSLIINFFAAIFLAGSGINTQTTYGAKLGFNNSMLFTLSLPVSRRRLLFVRAGLGAIQTSILVAIMAVYTLLQRPESTSALQALAFLTRSIVCTMAIYSFAVLLACLLDELWQFTVGSLCWLVVLALGFKFNAVSRISPLRGMSLISYPITAPMPWTPLAASLVFAGVLLCASVLVLQRKEF
jgi:F0F1-type ATP synthase membrane subunit c/vacuolar-type H+-ATPase subunit K